MSTKKTAGEKVAKKPAAEKTDTADVSKTVAAHDVRVVTRVFTKANIETLLIDPPSEPLVLPVRECLDAKTAAFHEAGHTVAFEKFWKEEDEVSPWEYVKIYESVIDGCFCGGTSSKNRLFRLEGAIQNVAGLAAESLLCGLALPDKDLASAVIDEWLQIDGSNDRLHALLDICDHLGIDPAEVEWPLSDQCRNGLIQATLQAFEILREHKVRLEQISKELLARLKPVAQISWGQI